MIELRDYQKAIIEHCRTQIRCGCRRLLVCSPTGSGKTALTTFMINGSAANGHRCIFLVHRVELIRQTAATFQKFGVEAGIIAAGFPENLAMPVQIASIPTVRRRLNRLGNFDVVVCDEAAHAPSKSWAEVLNAWPQAYHIGLSATPTRLDGSGFDALFDKLVLGPSTRQLIDAGWLAPYKLYAPPTADPAGLRVRAGDYVPEEAAALVDRPAIIGDVIQHYRKLTNGKRAIVFAASVAHSKNVAEAFNAAGIPARHIDGTTPPDERERAINDFRDGKTLVLSNVNIATEGLDIPCIESCIILRPTLSLALWLQICGRVLRPAEGKTAVILDHVGNCTRLGLPDDRQEWSLYGSTRKRRAANDNDPSVPIRVCGECYSVFKLRPTCPFCGAVSTPSKHELKQREGELKEVQRREAERERKQTRRAQGQAQTLEDLIEIGRKRGMKNPHGWAWHIMQARAAKGKEAA